MLGTVEYIGFAESLDNIENPAPGTIVTVDGYEYVFTGEWEKIVGPAFSIDNAPIVKMRPTNCVNCGSVLNGDHCVYCGTRYGVW